MRLPLIAAVIAALAVPSAAAAGPPQSLEGTSWGDDDSTIITIRNGRWTLDYPYQRYNSSLQLISPIPAGTVMIKDISPGYVVFTSAMRFNAQCRTMDADLYIPCFLTVSHQGMYVMAADPADRTRSDRGIPSAGRAFKMFSCTERAPWCYGAMGR